MSTESDQPMDRALKSYAEKRRQDAGAPLELHPATRRMLQAEAARLTPRATNNGTSWHRVLSGWLPRLAGVAALCAIAGLIGWIAFAPDSLRHEQSLAALSRDEVSLTETPLPAANAIDQSTFTTPLAAPPPAPPILAARPVEIVPSNAASIADAVSLVGAENEATALAMSGRTETSGLLGGSAGSAPGTRESKDAPMAKSIVAATRSDRRREIAGGTAPEIQLAEREVAAAMKSKSAATVKLESVALNLAATPPPAVMTPAAPEPAVPTPAASPFRARGAVDSLTTAPPVETQDLFFRQRPAPADATAGLRKKMKASALLTSFTWQQTGRQLRVVDADGSIYLGEVQENIELGPTKTNLSAATTEQRKLPITAFRISGTNQSLQQQVVIAGQLLRETETAAGRLYGLDKAAPASATASAPRNEITQRFVMEPTSGRATNLAQNAGAILRIEAQATLGDGKIMPIRAVNQ